MGTISPIYAEQQLDRITAYLHHIDQTAEQALMAVYAAAVALDANWDDTEYILWGLDDALFGTLVPHLVRRAHADADSRASLMHIASPHFLGGASI